MAWTTWGDAQMAGFPSENLICGQCGQRVFKSINLKIYVILYSYTVGINTHECSQPLVCGAIKNAWVHCPHDPPRKYYTMQNARTWSWPHGHMATWSWPASLRVVWTLPTLPPTKVLMTHGRWPPAARLAGRALFADGPRAGPAADGHGSGGATNKIFYCPHCPHRSFLKIFVIFSPCLKAYLLHRARSKRLRRA